MRRPLSTRTALAVAAAVISTLAFTTAAEADVYKSVDPNGQIRYSDVWSPGSTLVKGLSLKNGELTSSQGDDKGPAPRPASPDPSQAAAQKAVASDVAATRATQCETLKDQYAKEIRALRIHKPGTTVEDGQFMSTEEADAERVRTKQAMDEACGAASGQ